MPRPLRIQFAGAFYHVYHRGNRRERIFLDDVDYARFERMLFDAADECGVILHRWSQMPNHYHLLVETPRGNLAHFMQCLATRYAIYFNRRYSQVGHVFQGRYGSRLCDRARYYRELIRYVELNPYRGKRRLARIGDWKWSSHRYVMMPQSQWPKCAREGFRQSLEIFNGDLACARNLCAQYLAEGLAEGSWEDFYGNGSKSVLGDETFQAKIADRCEGERPPVADGAVPSARQWIETVSVVSGLSVEALRSPSREARFNAWRQAAVYIGRWYGLPMKSLARELCRTEAGTAQMLWRMGRDSNERKEVIALRAALRNKAA